MPQDVKIWEIFGEEELKEIKKSKLNLEERLEKWLEGDVSIISDDLLVIGRQVKTAFGKTIDLLCLDSDGDVVIAELKREKTARDITGQCLDYASWVVDLSNEQITDLADNYFKGRTTLDEAFKNKFGTEVPDILNENHKMLVIASKIDEQTERIIKYLSDSHGVGINAVTFHYFKQDGGKELLARVHLIEPSEADYKVETKSGSKRRRRLTYEELEHIADSNGVGGIYRLLGGSLENHFDLKRTTRSSLVFKFIMGENKRKFTVFNLIPGASSSENGLRYAVYLDRFSKRLGLDKQQVEKFLPEYNPKHDKREVYDYYGEYREGFFRDEKQVRDFLKIFDEVNKT